MAWLPMQLGDPAGKLLRIRDRRGQKHEANLSNYLVRQQDDAFLPDDPARFVPHVVHFVVDHPGHFAHELGAAIEHASQDLRGHDEALRIRVDADIACHEPDVLELRLHVPELLVAQRLDRRRVHHSLAIAKTLGNRILGHHGLASRGVRSHQDALLGLDKADAQLLKRIQRERILLRGRPSVLLRPLIAFGNRAEGRYATTVDYGLSAALLHLGVQRQTRRRLRVRALGRLDPFDFPRLHRETRLG
eukprot:scaffold4850_cov213-Pinguiococcus_pyrenoidosus.AAC.14